MPQVFYLVRPLGILNHWSALPRLCHAIVTQKAKSARAFLLRVVLVLFLHLRERLRGGKARLVRVFLMVEIDYKNRAIPYRVVGDGPIIDYDELHTLSLTLYGSYLSLMMA